MLKLLMVKTSSMGDVIHHLPVINDILRHHPDAQIDWVVEQAFADIPRLHPAVHQVFTVALREWRSSPFSAETRAQIRASKAAIGAQHYDLIIDAQGLLKSAWISTWAHGARHGYDWSSAREPLASFFYRHKHQVSRDLHAVTRNRLLTAQSLGYAAPEAFADFGLNPKRHRQAYVVAIHGTSRESKQWPLHHWVAFVHAMADRQLGVLLPWGNPAEQHRAEQIAHVCPNAEVLPRSSIRQLSSTIANASLVVGVDTGLSHLAVALDIPTIGIYTDTEPNKTGLYSLDNTNVLNLGGLAQIPSVEEVLKNVDGLLVKMTK
jgi:heptosyltransferase-1